MKTRGLLPALLFSASVALRAADPAAATAPLEVDKPSPGIKTQLNAPAPQYIYAPPASVDLKPAAAPDPDVLVLPKYTVKQRPRPRLGENVILGPDAFNEKLAKERMSSLDRNLLNKFTLPGWFGGVSAADRAREDYNREKAAELKTDVLHLAKAVEVTDPAQAKALRDAVNKP
jgi:hypothetical protein